MKLWKRSLHNPCSSSRTTEGQPVDSIHMCLLSALPALGSGFCVKYLTASSELACGKRRRSLQSSMLGFCRKFCRVRESTQIIYGCNDIRTGSQRLQDWRWCLLSGSGQLWGLFLPLSRKGPGHVKDCKLPLLSCVSGILVPTFNPHPQSRLAVCQ